VHAASGAAVKYSEGKPARYEDPRVVVILVDRNFTKCDRRQCLEDRSLNVIEVILFHRVITPWYWQADSPMSKSWQGASEVYLRFMTRGCV